MPQKLPNLANVSLMKPVPTWAIYSIMFITRKLVTDRHIIYLQEGRMQSPAKHYIKFRSYLCDKELKLHPTVILNIFLFP